LLRPPGTLKVVIFIAAMIGYATAGFMFFELESKPELQWVDALWWAVVTMTTVGFGDYFPASTSGRLLVGFPTMLAGMGMLGYALSQLAGFFIRAETYNRKGFVVPRCADPIIVCHYPSRARFVGVLDEIRAKPRLADRPVLLIDEHLAELDADLANANVHFVKGSPTRADVLGLAGVQAARNAVVLAKDPARADSDHLSAVTCLALKAASPELAVVAECVEPGNEELMRRCGCAGTVCVLRLTFGMLAHELEDRGVAEVIHELAAWGEQPNNLHVVPIELNAGTTPLPTYAELRRATAKRDFTLLGLRAGSDIALNPPHDRPLHGGEAAVVLSRERPDRIRLG
jgi:voltage-gated potassium channel